MGEKPNIGGDADFGGTLLSLHSIINKPVGAGSATGNLNLLVLDSIFALGNVGLGVERVLRFCVQRYRNYINENVYVQCTPSLFVSIFPPNSALEDIWGCCI